MSPMVEGFEENKVADLIDLVSRQWDLGLLQGLFNPNEVNLIRSTPLSSSSCDDKIIWPFNSSRQYSAQTEGKNLKHLAMMLWTIWFRRNQLRVNNKDYPASQVAVNAQQALARIGVVIRDSQGQAMASLSEQIHLQFSSDMVEALIVARAISFALDTGYYPFILEGDLELVIKTYAMRRDLLPCLVTFLSQQKL
nr:hypothetical protein CFP56_38186 [Quercus suber]